MKPLSVNLIHPTHLVFLQLSLPLKFEGTEHVKVYMIHQSSPAYVYIRLLWISTVNETCGVKWDPTNESILETSNKVGGYLDIFHLFRDLFRILCRCCFHSVDRVGRFLSEFCLVHLCMNTNSHITEYKRMNTRVLNLHSKLSERVPSSS